MFADERSKARIFMCADCRVADLYSEESRWIYGTYRDGDHDNTSTAPAPVSFRSWISPEDQGRPIFTR